MDRSLQNAFRVAERLAEMDNPPYLYICCHGQYREDIQNYVAQVFDRLTGCASFLRTCGRFARAATGGQRFRGAIADVRCT